MNHNAISFHVPACLDFLQQNGGTIVFVGSVHMQSLRVSSMQRFMQSIVVVLMQKLNPSVLISKVIKCKHKYGLGWPLPSFPTFGYSFSSVKTTTCIHVVREIYGKFISNFLFVKVLVEVFLWLLASHGN